MSQPKSSNEGHVAYSSEINAVRAVLVKHLNEYPADLLADLAQLLTEQKDEAAETAFKSAIKICELGDIKPPKSNEDFLALGLEMKKFLEDQGVEAIHLDSVAGRLAVLIQQKLAQKDKEVVEAVKVERDRWVKPLLEDAFMVTIEGRFDKRIVANRKVVSMKSVQSTGGRTLLLEAEACAHEILRSLSTPKE